MPTAPPQEVLDLLARLDAAIHERVHLLDRRRQMIGDYKRTGQRADTAEFSAVCDGLRINEALTLNLRAALAALGDTRGPQ